MDRFARGIKLLSLVFTITCVQNAVSQEAPKDEVEADKQSRSTIFIPSAGRRVSTDDLILKGGEGRLVEGADGRLWLFPEHTVKALETGAYLDWQGLDIINLDVEALRNKDMAALKPVLDVLSRHGIPVDELDLRYLTKDGRSVDLSDSNSIEISQFILEQQVGFIRFRIGEVDEDQKDVQIGTVVSVEGRVVNPNLPQLNPDNWISEKEAIQMATDVLLRDVRSDGASSWFLDAVEEGTLSGKMEIKIGVTSDAMTVEPMYVISNDKTEVRINRYDGSMKTAIQAPADLTTQTNTNVCTSGMTSNWTRCENDSSKPQHPQVHTVFAEW